MHEIIARIVDGSEFHEFKPLYGSTLVCGFAHIWGMPVAILANNGILFSESAVKGAHFIELACQRRTPLLFLQNISGFMVGGKYEAEGIAKHGAKLVTAVATASVPKITVLIGGSFGAGNYGMSRPRLLAALPVHLAQLAHQRDGRRAGGDACSPPSTATPTSGRRSRPKPSSNRSATITKRRAIPGTRPSRLWDDGIIDPAQTRDVLGLAFAACLNAPIPERPQFGVFRM